MSWTVRRANAIIALLLPTQQRIRRLLGGPPEIVECRETNATRFRSRLRFAISSTTTIPARPVIGDITSPFFGRANQSGGAASFGGTGFLESANNRRLEFQMKFSF
jgi:hypothetical protein